jgi:glycosyltransferase involved in cell wall biosynthesis
MNPEIGPVPGDRITVAMIAEYPRDLQSIDGGVQAVTAYLVAELIKSPDIDLHVVTFDAQTRSPEHIQEKGFHRYLLPAQRLGIVTRWALDFMLLQKCLRRIDPAVVHAQGAGVDGFLAVRSAYPSIVTVHGMIGEDAKYMSGIVARTRHTLHSLITEKYCARHATRTILISPYVREYYGALLRGTSHFIPNPVNQKFYDVERRNVPGRILFAGRLIPRKGVTDLFDAFAMVRTRVDARLVLAGSLSDKSYVRGLRRQARVLNIESAIEFRGLLQEHELLDEFSRASLLVLPSHQETAPMVIQQAMAASVPVVATRICGVPYQIDHGRTGYLFAPGDVRALAGYVEQLVTDEPARIRMASAARAKAISEYRAEQVAAQTLSVYRALGAGGRGDFSDMRDTNAKR